MPFGCATDFDTLEDVWQWGIWLFVSVGLYVLTSLTWSRFHYGIMYGASRRILLYEWLYRLLFLATMVTASYAAWRIWSCQDWSGLPVRLFLYILWLIVVILIHPVFFLAHSLVWNAVIYSAAFGMSLLMFILFIIRDLWAGIAFIAVSAFFMVHCLIHIYILVNGVNVAARYEDLRAKNIDKYNRYKNGTFSLKKHRKPASIKEATDDMYNPPEITEEDKRMYEIPDKSREEPKNLFQTADALNGQNSQDTVFIDT